MTGKEAPRAGSTRLQDLALRVLGVVLLAGIGLGVWSWWRFREVAKAPSLEVVAGRAKDSAGAPPPRLQEGSGDHRLAGYVVDGAGAPVVAVEVSATLEPTAPAQGAALGEAPAAVASSPTAADGGFALQGLGPGLHRLRVAGAGIFSSEVERVEVPGESLSIVVARKVSISGRVVERGQPVVGATVQVTGDAIGGTVELRSGPAGAFALPVLPEGAYDVLAYRNDLASPTLHLLRLGAGPFPLVELELGAAAVVSGRVFEAPAEAAGQAQGAGVVAAIELRPLADDQPPRYAQSGADGRFRVEGVHRGRWVVSAVAPGYVLPEPVEIDAGQGVVELAVAAGGVLEGRVLDGAGKPLPGATLRALAAGRQQELSGEREESLLAHFGGRTMVAAAAWDAGAAARLDPRFVPRGELGVLLGPVPLIPPPGARAARRGAMDVSELPPEVAQLARPAVFAVPSQRASQWTTDEQGRYVLRGLPPGRYTLIARAPMHAEGRRAGLVVMAGGVEHGVDLTLSPGTVIHGVVRSQRGAPIVGARVVATSATSAVETRSNGDGSYRLPPVTGAVQVEVTASGHASVTRRLDTGQVAGSVAAERREDLELQIYDAVLRGVVDDARGAPVAGARVSITHGPAQGRVVTTAADGTFSIDQLPAGPARLQVMHPELPTYRGTADPSAPVRLALPFGGGVEGRVVDDAGLPVAHVRVLGSGPEGESAEDTTERDGAWALRALRPGAWKLSVLRAGFLPVARTIQVVAGPARGAITQRDVKLALARGAVAAGTVRDHRGARVADARVLAQNAEGAVAEGRTDARGEFRLRDCPTGELSLSAEHAGAKADMRLFLRPGQEVATLVLELVPAP